MEVKQDYLKAVVVSNNDTSANACQECINLCSKGLQEDRRRKPLYSIGDLEVGDTAKIVFIREEQPALQRIFEAGLTIGTEVAIEQTLSSGEAVEVNLGKAKVLMGPNVAAKVFVELIKPK
ncbi:MAG: FeoA family protein [Candidatus Bathyarchaeia archaeon]